MPSNFAIWSCMKGISRKCRYTLSHQSLLSSTTFPQTHSSPAAQSVLKRELFGNRFHFQLNCKNSPTPNQASSLSNQGQTWSSWSFWSYLSAYQSTLPALTSQSQTFSQPLPPIFLQYFSFFPCFFLVFLLLKWCQWEKDLFSRCFESCSFFTKGWRSLFRQAWSSGWTSWEGPFIFADLLLWECPLLFLSLLLKIYLVNLIYGFQVQIGTSWRLFEILEVL